MLGAVAAEVLALLQSPEGAAAIGAIVEERAAAAVRRALAEQGEALQPLAAILGCSVAAARMRLTRDGELRALGHVADGRGRLVFRASEVRSLLAGRNPSRGHRQRRAPRLRMVREG